MTLPLPTSSNRSVPVERSNSGNRGLYYNKFFDLWKWEEPPNSTVGIGTVIDADGKKKEGKAAWVEKFCGKYSSNEKLAIRVKALVETAAGRTETFFTQGPLVTGTGLPHPVENGFLWHHTLGVPYLPASSVKGMLRAWARDWQEQDCGKGSEVARLLGTISKDGKEMAAGVLIVFDALPVGEIELYKEVLTPHDGGWRISPNPTKNPPADWISPVPIPFLAIKKATFQFALGLRKGGTPSDLEIAFALLKDALDWIGAGAKTSVGFGRMLDQGGMRKQADDEEKRQARWHAEEAAIAAQPKLPPPDGTRIPAGREIELINGDLVTLTTDYIAGRSGAIQVRKENGNFARIQLADVADWSPR